MPCERHKDDPVVRLRRLNLQLLRCGLTEGAKWRERTELERHSHLCTLAGPCLVSVLSSAQQGESGPSVPNQPHRCLPIGAPVSVRSLAIPVAQDSVLGRGEVGSDSLGSGETQFRVQANRWLPLERCVHQIDSRLDSVFWESVRSLTAEYTPPAFQHVDAPGILRRDSAVVVPLIKQPQHLKVHGIQ